MKYAPLIFILFVGYATISLAQQQCPSNSGRSYGVTHDYLYSTYGYANFLDNLDTLIQGYGIGSSGYNDHLGVDIFVNAPNTIYAICDGTITNDSEDFTYQKNIRGRKNFSAYWNSRIILKCDKNLDNNDYFAIYMHVDKQKVANNTHVDMGMSIGEITPAWVDDKKLDPSKDHLHFGIRAGHTSPFWFSNGISHLGIAPTNVSLEEAKNNGYQDPLTYICSNPKSISGENLDHTCRNIKSNTPKPLATAIVFDKSGSMADERKIDYAREASFTYAREMKTEDLLSLSTFSSDAVTPAGLEIKNKTEISPKLADILPTLRPDGQTNIGAGLTIALKQLCSVPSDQVKKGALLLSDGMNNVGSYDAVVTEYRDLAIPIYTVKFGKEASEKDLRDIAAKTSGIYMDSDTTNLTDAYRYIYAAINGDSVRIASHDPMGPKDSLAYEIDVSPDARALQIGTSWQGSRLKTVLTSPSGAAYTGNQLLNQADRFEAGRITQFTQINAPESGRWQIDLTWDDPPPAAERVNLFVSEHSDVYASLYGFSPEYSPGQQVTMNVHAAELDGGNNKIPLKNARVRARVQIPGPEVIRLIQAQGTNVRISENISQEIYREVELFDDGQHADYSEGDGIFGGFFSETQLKGSYIVSAHIEGERTNGAHVSRDSRGAFHVGSLMDNGVFTSDLMRYAQQLEERMKTKVTNPLGKMQGNPASDIEIPASGKKSQSRSLMDNISN